MTWPQEAFLNLRQILKPKGRPGSGGNLLYVKADNNLYLLDADGTEHAVGGSGGGAGVSSVNTRTGAVTLTSTDVGLGNVDNTADTAKPISTATSTALAGKEPTIAGGTTAQYWRGDKSMQTLSADVVPDGTTNKAYTATEKTKLSGVATGATANSTDATLLARANHTGTQAAGTITGLATVATTGAKADVGLGLVPNVDATARASHTGTQSADTLTDGTTNKAFLATERTKLTGIATAATANSTDATLLARANHTGTQAVGTITGLAAVATSGAKADVGLGLVPNVDATARSSHTGTQSADTLTDGTTNKAFLATERTKLAGLSSLKTKSVLATATTTTETVVLKLTVPANTFAVGDIIRFALTMTPAATSITTTRIRIGAAGTIADAAVIVMAATAATNAGTRRVEGETAIRAIGATASHLGSGTETVGALSANGVATASSGTFDSTVSNFVTVTVQNTTSTTTTVWAGILELV